MIEKIHATVIVDNVANDGLKGEWGLAIAIDCPKEKVLLDVGGSDLFAENAAKLGVDIADMDYAVLSHAHYDHSLGMEKFFHINQKAKFYIRETTDENCYIKKFFFKKYIGIPRDVLPKYPDRICVVSGDYKLSEDIYLIPHHTPNMELIGKREAMYQKTAKGWKIDDFSHEQSLVFDTSKGLVIFNSCSHGGAANIINEVSALFPDRPVYGMIGGFHLFNKTEDEVRSLAQNIKKTGIQYVCTGHCTKERAYDILKDELGDTLHQLHVGLEMEF